MGKCGYLTRKQSFVYEAVSTKVEIRIWKLVDVSEVKLKLKFKYQYRYKQCHREKTVEEMYHEWMRHKAFKKMWKRYDYIKQKNIK